MAREVRVIDARDYLRATQTGHVDVEESLRLLREVVDRLEGTEAFDVMLDTRNANSTLTASELWFLADAAAKHPRVQSSRVCILSSEERFDHARFYALCAERKGVEMEVFVSYEEAMKWLLMMS